MNGNACNDCGSYTCFEPPPKYELDYHAYRWSVFRPKFWLMWRKAWKCLPNKPSAVCDVGCGAQQALWWARIIGNYTVGWDIKGTPNNYVAHQFLTDSFGEFSQQYVRTFDVVWCWHTLEHSDNPIEFIDGLKQLLVNGGTLYLECPVAEYTEGNPEHFAFPEHRGVPSEKWIRSLLPNCIEEIPTEGRLLMMQYGNLNYHRRFVYHNK